MMVRLVNISTAGGWGRPPRVIAWKPSDPLLEKVQDGYSRWDRASRALMASLVGDTATPG